jgi:hypothetical protein
MKNAIRFPGLSVLRVSVLKLYTAKPERVIKFSMITLDPGLQHLVPFLFFPLSSFPEGLCVSAVDLEARLVLGSCDLFGYWLLAIGFKNQYPIFYTLSKSSC